MLVFIISMCLLFTGKYKVWQLQKKYLSQLYSKKPSDTAGAISSASLGTYWSHMDITDTTALSVLTWMIPNDSSENLLTLP